MSFRGSFRGISAWDARISSPALTLPIPLYLEEEAQATAVAAAAARATAADTSIITHGGAGWARRGAGHRASGGWTTEEREREKGGEGGREREKEQKRDRVRKRDEVGGNDAERRGKLG
jgi:hypothetical protein